MVPVASGASGAVFAGDARVNMDWIRSIVVDCGDGARGVVLFFLSVLGGAAALRSKR
jgi:hypothetical protein